MELILEFLLDVIIGIALPFLWGFLKTPVGFISLLILVGVPVFLNVKRVAWDRPQIELEEESHVTEGRGAGSPLKGLPLYYDLLGVEPGASPDEVSRAHGELLRECDPEHLPEGSEQRPEAEIRLQSIKIAYRKIRETWPESLQQVTEAFEQETWPESVQAELAEAFKQDDDLKSPRASSQAFRLANRQFVRKLRIALVVLGVGGALAVLADLGSPFFLVATGVVSFYTPWIALDKRNPTLTGGPKIALTVLLGVPMFFFLVFFYFLLIESQ